MRFNAQFHGMLDVAIEIFNDHHPKGFLHDLVSSQLDMDRMDYLQPGQLLSRVSREGHDQLRTHHSDAQRARGAARGGRERASTPSRNSSSLADLMYWQVYLHKTVLAAEWMMMRILERAGEIGPPRGPKVWATPALAPFLDGGPGPGPFHWRTRTYWQWVLRPGRQRRDVLRQSVAAPRGRGALPTLCQRLLDRRLFKIELRDAALRPRRHRGTP